ncbi:hypothetical protein Tco_0465436, partial [Tanacetum coccineum]
MMIGKSNLRLSSNLKSKEPTIQVVLDALKLTPFYNAFEISNDVPEIYMQEFCVTVTRHHSLLGFKLDGKSHTVNVDNFRDMLKIYPKLLGQKFEEPPLEEDILSFIKDLGHTGEIKFLSDVNVNHMHQPWKSFAAIINKCLSGKTTALESLRLSRAQILWGIYHNKLVDFVYLLWEDLVFQVENKNSKKTNDMDDFMFTTIRVISKHKDTQEYGAILPQHLTNQAMLESKAFMTYRAYATGEKAPKSKATKKKTDFESSPKTKPSPASKGKRIKTSAKGVKPATTKSKGLTVLSEVALFEAEQMKLATKRSLTEFHVSHASGSGDGVDLQLKVPDEQQQTRSGTNEGAGDNQSQGEEEKDDDDKHNNDENDEEHDSDDDNDDNDDEDNDQENDSQRTELDDEGDDFVHPNLSKYIADDQEKEKEEEKVDDDDNDDVTSDQKVSTPPDYELTEEDENQQDDDTMGEEQGDEDNGELYGDLNINLSRSDAEMTDAQTNPEIEEARVTLTNEPPVVQLQSSSASSDLVAKFINPSPDTEIPNFASLFGFERRVSSLESDLSELKQCNQFAKVLSSIPGIVDKYLETKVKNTVDVVVQLKSDKLREEAQAENQDFLNSINSNMKRIIKEQTSYAVASSLSDLELKKILMDKMEENNSIDRSNVQKNLYRALLEAYNSDKDLLSLYGEVRQRSGKEESSKEATQKKLKSTSPSKEPFYQEFDTGNDDVSPVREETDVDERLWNPFGSRTPDREWNQTKTIDDRPPQQWMTKLAQASGTTSLFNEFLATPIDFSAFIMNRLNIQHLTQDLLTDLTYDIIKGTCKSVVELEYHLEEVFKATNDQLDWHNPKRRPYPHDLSKPLPLIMDARGRLIILYDHFINNDLEYLKGGSSSRKYTTSITKTKAADYGDIKWIEDKIPKSTWSEAQVVYDKYVVTSLKIMEFFCYKHLEEIIVRRQDDN